MKKYIKIFIIVFIIIFIVGLLIIISKVNNIYNKSKRLSSSDAHNSIILDSISDNSIENIAETTDDVENKEVKTEEKSEYVSPYSGNYGKSLETIFIHSLNKENNIYKLIMSDCESFGYTIDLSNVDGYKIKSNDSLALDSLVINIDKLNDNVSKAYINYADMLKLTYNPSSIDGSFIFENIEQGDIEYFNSATEATDTLLRTIEMHKYDSNNQPIVDEEYNWQSDVTDDTDQTVFSGFETLDEITVPDYFDANYYQMANPDVVLLFGTDPKILYRHYRMSGKLEGRLPSLNIKQKEEKVYINKTGKHYHKNNCKFLNEDAYEISLEMAMDNNHDRCPICNP